MVTIQSVPAALFPQGGGRLANFLLVHGAWHGAWCWAQLRRLLVTAIADRMPDRLPHLVYLDAVVPKPGKS